LQKISWLILAIGCMELALIRRPFLTLTRSLLFLCSASFPPARHRGTTRSPNL
jgi:hypothetical protein